MSKYNVNYYFEPDIKASIISRIYEADNSKVINGALVLYKYTPGDWEQQKTVATFYSGIWISCIEEKE